MRESIIMEKEKWKGGALIAPLPPVLVSCGTSTQPNLLTVAWTGMVNTNPPKTYISVRPSRYSYPLIQSSREFVLNLTTADLVRAADFCGVRSGKDVNKWEAMNLTPDTIPEVSCPILAESPVNIPCRVTEIIPLGSHDMFLADILAVYVDSSLLDSQGKLHLDKSGLAAYAHGEYFSLGKKLGTFGFSVRKKRKKPSHGHRA